MRSNINVITLCTLIMICVLTYALYDRPKLPPPGQNVIIITLPLLIPDYIGLPDSWVVHCVSYHMCVLRSTSVHMNTSR